ncbi:DUF6019 family protein [Variovorax boronicumulans]|uniref:DUF6019 family protein n=1 Tax=Variovorax boronicumulans TaxID=436515 RepID=UPI00358EF109
MRQTQLENALAQWFLAELAIGLIGMFIMLTILYFVIRWGVRDGMRDAQRGTRAERPPARSKHDTAGLPDLRAD